MNMPAKTDLNRYKYLFGLIGFPLSHSFSKKYFSAKFEKEGIEEFYYELFPLESIEEFPNLIGKNPNLIGLNVTVPYKEAVIPFLDELDESAAAVNAVNVISIQPDKRVGYNSDVYGFQKSLENFLTEVGRKPNDLKALILGTGGAAKAVQFVLTTMQIPFLTVSRSAHKGKLTYDDLDQRCISSHKLIINTTPLGMAPNVHTCPPIPYENMEPDHLLFDLVYNPETTLFLEKGFLQGAKGKNGMEMLHLQAERAWEIWKKKTEH